VLDELRSGAVHLTGLFLLAPYLGEQNADALLEASRGLSRRTIEQLIARWFPKADAPARIDPSATQPALPMPNEPPQSGRPAAKIGPGTSESLPRGKVEPLSAASPRAVLRDCRREATQRVWMLVLQRQEPALTAAAAYAVHERALGSVALPYLTGNLDRNMT
jgi:hypothetical protein